MVKLVPNLSVEHACDALRNAGVTCSREEIQIVAREER
jgi:hypothetical protein